MTTAIVIGAIAAAGAVGALLGDAAGKRIEHWAHNRNDRSQT